jgi:serine/threonine protein kinase
MGGMGEVYRALDTRLGRDAAIKILPAAFASDPDRLTRFEREARLLAALNHPNIATIYGLERESGPEGWIHAIAMELVEGETLAEQIQKSPNGLPIKDSLFLARQIAEALDAAHEKGIVHRDLKPANIKVTPTGAVKVLDFGLAKLSATDAESETADAMSATTLAGTRDAVMGTPAYMSPEQARGHDVDKRTDIWAFGCVLYEMLTGRPAFARDTLADTLSETLTHEPDWSSLPSQTPDAVRRLLLRCLEKDAKKRLRDIGDARNELDEALSRTSHSPSAAAGSSKRSILWLAASLAVVALLIYVGARFRSREHPSASNVSIEQLTRDSGLTTMPAVSADGKLIAFASDRAGHGDLDVWVEQMSGGTPLQVTSDPADDQMPDFSPDGSQIAFRSERGTGGVYIVSAFGGPARLVANGGQWPRFSPDGSRIAYWVGQWRGQPSVLPTQAFVLDLLGGTPQPLLPGFVVARDPRWAPAAPSSCWASVIKLQNWRIRSTGGGFR